MRKFCHIGPYKGAQSRQIQFSCMYLTEYGKSFLLLIYHYVLFNLESKKRPLINVLPCSWSKLFTLKATNSSDLILSENIYIYISKLNNYFFATLWLKAVALKDIC